LAILESCGLSGAVLVAALLLLRVRAFENRLAAFREFLSPEERNGGWGCSLAVKTTHPYVGLSRAADYYILWLGSENGG
jgi:hypothetical protein